jgi:hypothetical protein
VPRIGHHPDMMSDSAATQVCSRRPAYVTVLVSAASSVVEVVALHDARPVAEDPRQAARTLPIYYRRDAAWPRVGERLDTWRDGATRWVMAPL